MLQLTLRQINKYRTIYNVPNAFKHHHVRPLSSFSPPLRKTEESTRKFNKPQAAEDREYLVRIQNNPDIFGAEPPRIETLDEGDRREDEHLTNERRMGKELSTKQYADMIKALLRKQKIKEAIDIVEVKMLKEDKVQPENYLYNLLLGACGRVGYTKKAFQLFNDMKKRGLAVHPGAYTALFNACANSPWPEDGLMRAKQLHNSMIEKGYAPNDSNYHAMMKAYGRCGDINAAFGLVDEMIKRKFPIKDDTLNFLLQACISDKEAGFRHALLVWHKFMRKRISPSSFSYNLLLRATRDCGLGDLDSTRDVLRQILPANDKFLQISARNEEVDSGNGEVVDLSLQKREIPGGLLEIDNLDETTSINRPNLLAAKPQLGDIVLIDEIAKAEDRLLLLGGAQNVLEDMQKKECKPDIKTFTQLLDCLPSTMTAEKELLKEMKKLRTKPDLDFYNMLIKKRSLRFDYEGAKDVLGLINKAGFQPDLITYGILALGCKNKDEAVNFLAEMEAGKYRLNAEILGAMLQQSTYHFDFPYVMFVMERCVDENLQPNAIFMERLEKFHNKCKKLSNDDSSQFGNNKRFQKGFKIFRMRLKTWKDQVKPEEDVHPWQQFRQPVETDTKYFKEDTSSRFKPRYLSKYRQKQAPTELVSKKSSKNKTKRYKMTSKKPTWRPTPGDKDE